MNIITIQLFATRIREEDRGKKCSHFPEQFNKEDLSITAKALD